ncbi:MAG: hypothetical protein WB819_11395 [Terriglobia bacterium]|jgi:hypothetical protein
MASTRQFTLPDERFRLEEINMPQEMAGDLAGKSVVVKVLPEMPSRTLRIDLDNPRSPDMAEEFADRIVDLPSGIAVLPARWVQGPGRAGRKVACQGG